jgi:hypothetical protein
VHLGIVKTLFLLHILYGRCVGVAWARRGRIVFVVFSWLALPGLCLGSARALLRVFLVLSLAKIATIHIIVFEPDYRAGSNRRKTMEPIKNDYELDQFVNALAADGLREHDFDFNFMSVSYAAHF